MSNFSKQAQVWPELQTFVNNTSVGNAGDVLEDVHFQLPKLLMSKISGCNSPPPGSRPRTCVLSDSLISCHPFTINARSAAVIYAADKAPSGREASAAPPERRRPRFCWAPQGLQHVQSAGVRPKGHGSDSAVPERKRSGSQLCLATGGAAAERQNRTGGSWGPENELGPSAFPHICRVYREQTRLFAKALMTPWKNNFLKSRHLIRDPIFFIYFFLKTFKEIIVEGNVYQTNEVTIVTFVRFISLTIEITPRWG